MRFKTACAGRLRTIRGNLSILFMRFGTEANFTWNEITVAFNSLYEILRTAISLSLQRLPQPVLSILFMRFWKPSDLSQPQTTNTAFNSLYEIPSVSRSPRRQRQYCLSILFMRFRDLEKKWFMEDRSIFQFSL